NVQQARAMVADGHFVGPQSDGWASLIKESSRSARSSWHKRYPEVAAHLKQLTPLGLDRKTPRFFLPTRDQINSATAQRASDCGLTMIAGTPGTLSSATATVEGTPEFASSQAILESILAREQQDPSGLNGYLLLFQLDSGARGSDKFPAHFGELLEALRQRGYEFVRVDELLNAVPQPLHLANTQPQ
ncbi:MAG TPA: hypothetical protein VNT26_08935, partial [Candidatus Sulfotelmatobacter sp.]|nr:hypothetical protein [Candidatus Sulfotelmatobacter sp.]